MSTGTIVAVVGVSLTMLTMVVAAVWTVAKISGAIGDLRQSIKALRDWMAAAQKLADIHNTRISRLEGRAEG